MGGRGGREGWEENGKRGPLAGKTVGKRREGLKWEGLSAHCASDFVFMVKTPLQLLFLRPYELLSTWSREAEWRRYHRPWDGAVFLDCPCAYSRTGAQSPVCVSKVAQSL